MSNIDFSHMITEDQKAAAQNARHLETLKAECSRRIAEVLDPFTVANIQGAAIAGDLDAVSLGQFRLARQWIEAMQQRCRNNSTSPVVEVDWPPVPDGVRTLAERF